MLTHTRLLIRKALVYTHRWLGITGCVLFVAWFLSGIVMMYARMPEVLEEERLARAAPLDLSRVALSPADAAARHHLSADRVRVSMFRDRPVYRLGQGRRDIVVFADTGDLLTRVDKGAAAAIAGAYLRSPDTVLRYDGYLTRPDQWTLQARAALPLHRFAANDEGATHIYVSETSGDLIMRTTRRERLWGLLGPVVHWLYFTPLRQNGSLWSQVVIWSSAIGCGLCLTGLIWGVWRFSPASHFRLRRVHKHSPYAGFMKWHHYAGLLFGLFALTWTYSGLLSMEPFGWFNAPAITRAQREAATGGDLSLDRVSLESMRMALAAMRVSFTPKHLETVQFRGEPFWLAYVPPPLEEAPQYMEAGLFPRAALRHAKPRYVSAIHPDRGVIAAFDRAAMEQIAREAMPGVAIAESAWLDAYDGYYYDSRGARPLPVLRVRYRDSAETWLYLDPARGAIVRRVDRTSRLQRWAYHGLHSLDFPFLYYRRPLWDIVVIALSIGGVVLSAVSLVPAWRRLRRHARRLMSVRGATSR